MRVLIAARHSPHGKRPIGGVQTWGLAVAKVLQGRGHSVDFWEPGQRLNSMYDLCIIANYVETREVLKFCNRYVNVSHGVIAPEKPSAKNAVFTSEELREHWGHDGPIVRQPIDVDFWSPANDSKVYLTRFSYRHGLTFVPDLARRFKLRYKHVRKLPPIKVREVLRKSACVLATGRAALEAMACGAPTVICDHRASYQQALMDLDVEGAMLRNYSGRGGIKPMPRNTGDAISSAMERGSLRDHVEQNHNAESIVDQLLEHAA